MQARTREGGRSWSRAPENLAGPAAKRTVEAALLAESEQERDRVYTPGMMRLPTYDRVVTNRVFLLGLDEFYREAIKRHERDELLT
jgi:hypothetical protein